MRETRVEISRNRDCEPPSGFRVGCFRSQTEPIWIFGINRDDRRNPRMLLLLSLQSRLDCWIFSVPRGILQVNQSGTRGAFTCTRDGSIATEALPNYG
jgi:hypothetical protein